MGRKKITGLLGIAMLLTVSMLSGKWWLKNPAKENQRDLGIIKPHAKKIIEERKRKTGPWYQRITAGLEPGKKEPWQDSIGKTYWKIKNKGMVPTGLSSDIHSSLTVPTGQEGKLYRENSFWVTVRAVLPHYLPGKEKPIQKVFYKRIETKNHYIEIHTPYVGKNRVLKLESKE